MNIYVTVINENMTFLHFFFFFFFFFFGLFFFFFFSFFFFFFFFRFQGDICLQFLPFTCSFLICMTALLLNFNKAFYFFIFFACFTFFRVLFYSVKLFRLTFLCYSTETTHFSYVYAYSLGLLYRLTGFQ